MKILCHIIFFSGLSLSVLSQEQGDSAKNMTFNPNGCYIGGGLNVTQYNSDNFFKYLIVKTGAANLLFIDHYYYVQMGDTAPKKINYNNPLLGPVIYLGVELNSNFLKKLRFHH